MSEQIKCVLHNIKKAKMFGQWDDYNVAVTDTRCIFAKLTGDLLKKAAAEAKTEKFVHRGCFFRKEYGGYNSQEKLHPPYTTSGK